MKTPHKDLEHQLSGACHRVLVWDLPTRLFHWFLVGLVVLTVATGKIGGNAMTYHLWGGFAILALVLFRVLWGLVGGRHARFRDFVQGPRAVMAYASSLFGRDAQRCLGHNPLGGWSILALLLVLLIQAATGLFANDDILTEGPLAVQVSKAASDTLTRVHRLNQNALLILVAIHVAAVFFYLVGKRENLIIPMVTGRKCWHTRIAPVGGHPLLALVLLLFVAVILYVLVFYLFTPPTFG
ncbi:MAG: cytochrome b/b6 domain-containing protein [Desulfobacterales bacterium]|jgi:cytochrome b